MRQDMGIRERVTRFFYSLVKRNAALAYELAGTLDSLQKALFLSAARLYEVLGLKPDAERCRKVYGEK